MPRFVAALLLICAAAACGRGNSAEPLPDSRQYQTDKAAPTDSVLMREVDALVEENRSIGAIKRLDIDAHRVYMNRSAWLTWDTDERKTFTTMLAIYCDERGAVHGRYVDVIEDMTNRPLAHYDPLELKLF